MRQKVTKETTKQELLKMEVLLREKSSGSERAEFIEVLILAIFYPPLK